MKAYFYTVKGFIAYDRGDEADAEKQLSEALSLYESYLTEDPANMDYLLNKSVLLSGLEETNGFGLYCKVAFERGG